MTTGKGQARDTYGTWRAPPNDGGLLIWPDAPRILELARRNQQGLANAQLTLGGLPLQALRAAARQAVGYLGDGPLIATGHQCELQHPGVWIKNAVICGAADAGGGEALHFAVDTDAPKHLKLKWPGFSAPITDDPRINSAAWSGLLAAPTAGHLEYLLRAAESVAHDGRVSELALRFLRHLGAAGSKSTPGQATLLARSMMAAQAALDVDLGLTCSAVALSQLLASESWACFVCSFAADARNFAATYNAALDDYRTETGIDSPQRPAPNLVVTRKRVEIPFWLDELATGRRHRAELVDLGTGFALEAPISHSGGAPLAFAGGANDAMTLLSWLGEHRLRLAPRALSLTMFLRLCVCDLFVHGIGGGLYDQVTDRIIRAWLGIEPPSFAVATATLYHPLAAGRQRVDVAALRQEHHKSAHEVLGGEKRRWLAQIAGAADPRERRRIFEQMHVARRQAMNADASHSAAANRLTEAQRQSADEAELFDRELFYAIQPAKRLEGLVARVRAAFGLHQS